MVIQLQIDFIPYDLTPTLEEINHTLLNYGVLDVPCSELKEKKRKNLLTMQAGIKHYTYRSTMLAYTDFFDFLEKEVKEQKIVDVIMMLWSAYSIGTLLNSAYFECLTVGDGWYKIHVQKYVNDTYSVKIEINPNYANALERFTK